MTLLTPSLETKTSYDDAAHAKSIDDLDAATIAKADQDAQAAQAENIQHNKTRNAAEVAAFARTDDEFMKIARDLGSHSIFLEAFSVTSSQPVEPGGNSRSDTQLPPEDDGSSAFTEYNGSSASEDRVHDLITTDNENDAYKVGFDTDQY